MTSHDVEQAGAGLPRRLLGRAVSSLWVVGALLAGWLLWPSSLGGCTTLTIVAGESMEPTYSTGDLVVSRCGAPEVGDVVVYQPPGIDGARVIHRIVDGDGTGGWTVQGDNNGFLDPWTPTDDDVLGAAVLHVPWVGRVAAILLSPFTWVSLLVVALAVVVWPGRADGSDDTTGTDGMEREADEAPAPSGGAGTASLEEMLR